MKYTLTIETDKKLTHCWHCPLLAIDVWENHYCCAGAEIIKYGTVIPVPGDCPLEDTDAEINRQEQCEWCRRFSTMATQDNTAIYPPTREKVVFNYCPNCGREL